MKSAGLFCGILLAALAASAASFDFTGYSRLLGRTVKPNGMVNYWGLQAGQSALDEIIEAMQKVSLDEFAAWPESERLAFLINAYNARVLQIISRQRHVLFRTNRWFQKGLSVRRYDGFFDEIPVRLLGRDRTLDSLEDELRRYYSEPGVHMALVKGARGSPPLRSASGKSASACPRCFEICAKTAPGSIPGSSRAETFRRMTAPCWDSLRRTSTAPPANSC